MRNIAVVTGSRAEYGLLRPVMKAIQAKQGLNLYTIVTGMHLSHEYGYTINEIENDGYNIMAKVDMLPIDDTLGAMARSIGKGINGMSHVWEQLKPDIILILGDRTEALATAISGVYMNISVAHIHGGDSPYAGLDEYARHAITKLAHIHFPATKKSAERIIKMGEDKWRVHIVGSPALDTILNEILIPPNILAKRLGIDLSQPIILLVQHSVTTQVNKAVEQIEETMEAIRQLAYQTIVINPNSDAGGRVIIDIIQEYAKYPFIKIFQNLPHNEYLSLMKVANVMVGNSSSGIIEAPSFGLPVVNIGIRQYGRERGQNIIDVKHNKDEIIEAINKALIDNKFLTIVKKCQSPYGDGRTAKRITNILWRIELNPKLINKKLTY